jgi:hypothetical protein
MNKSVFTLLFLILPLIIYSQEHQETITITTYYPAPYGVYRHLRFSPTDSAPPCDSNNRGTMYYDNSEDTLKICTTLDGTYELYSLIEIASLWAQSGSNLYPNDLSWNVGIGTTNPVAKLEIQNQQDVDWDNQFMIINGFFSGHPRMLVMGYDDANDYGAIASLIHQVGYTPLVLQPDGGNVGIGTTNPGEKLDINGSVRISDDILVRDSSNNFDSLFSGGIIKEKFLPYCQQEITSDVYTNGQNQATGCNFGGYTGYYNISNLTPENVKEGVTFGRDQVGTLEVETLDIPTCPSNLSGPKGSCWAYVSCGLVAGNPIVAKCRLGTDCSSTGNCWSKFCISTKGYAAREMYDYNKDGSCERCYHANICCIR